tara:strand:- start:6520 stop:8067 length:1548 start_codon:yes stop_codon:yes gene_type:complete
MDFQYKTQFDSKILASEDATHLERLGISQASLDSLKPLIPTSIDLERNIDLIGVAFNAAVVNKFNKNGDGIDTDTALGIKEYFVNKPTNIEHKKQKVVGHIVSSAFSAYGSNKLLSDTEVQNLRDPFNIALAAVVYKTVNPRFADLLEDDENEYDEIISASWELGFNDYYLALGSDNLEEAEIITDPKHIKEFSQYLKAYDGDGHTSEGVSVSRLIVGEIFPLGIAFTTNPAAEVEGIYVEDVAATEEEQSATSESINFNLFNKKISQCDKTDVNPKNESILMDNDIIKQFEDILSKKLDNKQFPEEAMASMAQVINDAIMQKDEEYKAELEARQNAEAEIQAAQEAVNTELKAVSEQLAASNSELADLKQEKAVAEAKERFNVRMSTVDQEFELNDEDRLIIVNDLRSLNNTEESFASYQEKLRVMWIHKAKAYLEETEKLLQERIDQEVTRRLEELSEAKSSGETPEVEDVLDGVEAEAEELLTNNNAEAAQVEPSLRDKFEKAFSRENLTIN